MKSNKEFAILSSIGIIMVVIAHCDGVINILSNFFPYNSFFMPMFMFISGYFFKDKNVENFKNFKIYLRKKSINLLLYYFIWNIIYGIIRIILYKLNLDNTLVKINIRSLIISPFIDGQQYSINSPAWFVPTLFTIEIGFCVIRKIQILCKEKLTWLSLVLFLIANCMSVVISMKFQYSNIVIPILKFFFFLFFFQLGKLYKDKIEVFDNKISSVIVIIITVLINLICLKLYRDLSFSSLYNMRRFKDICVPCYIPIITGITGIWFWLRISKNIASVIKENSFLIKISNNTKPIMTHHIFCMLCINIVLYYTRNIIGLSDFNVENFIKNGGWYRYYADLKQLEVIYIVFGIYGSIKINEFEKFIVKKLKNIYSYYKENLKIDRGGKINEKI